MDTWMQLGWFMGRAEKGGMHWPKCNLGTHWLFITFFYIYTFICIHTQRFTKLCLSCLKAGNRIAEEVLAWIPVIRFPDNCWPHEKPWNPGHCPKRLNHRQTIAYRLRDWVGTTVSIRSLFLPLCKPQHFPYFLSLQGFLHTKRNWRNLFRKKTNWLTAEAKVMLITRQHMLKNKAQKYIKPACGRFVTFRQRRLCICSLNTPSIWAHTPKHIS